MGTSRRRSGNPTWGEEAEYVFLPLKLLESSWGKPKGKWVPDTYPFSLQVYALTYMVGAWGWGGSCSWLWSLCRPVCVGSIGKVSPIAHSNAPGRPTHTLSYCFP